jgi:hypothetical protein
MGKFKLLAIDTNLDVYPPIFQGTVYDGVDEITTYFQGHPPLVEYTIEVEEYDQLITWGVPTTSIKRYKTPAYLFKKIEDEKPKCICGQESTWKALHKRSCPPDKHSDWCEVYKK